MKRVLVLSKYGPLAASTRQRFLQHAPHYADAGIEITVRPLLDDAYLASLYRAGRSYRRVVPLYARRLAALAEARRFDALIVHCELFPYLPGVFERLASLPRRPVIFDYDDAIFHQYDDHPDPRVRRLLGGKLAPLLRRADLAICGNAYLRDYAARFCGWTEVAPTTVDTEVFRPGMREHDATPVIGWIGSPSTVGYLAPLMPLLTGSGLAIDIVGGGSAAPGGPGVRRLDWSAENEVALIQGMGIGIMPVPDEPWARGKCGYKLIQYMACGLPVIASPVGANTEIVEHGKTGFLAPTDHEWREAINVLAADPALRREMGAAGRRRAERLYSAAVHGPRLADMVGRVIDGTGRRVPNAAPNAEGLPVSR